MTWPMLTATVFDTNQSSSTKFQLLVYF